MLGGKAYKKDIDDVRESPALDIIELLSQKGAAVRYHDPFVPDFYYNGHAFVSEPNLDAAFSAADYLLIVTNHSAYDWTGLAGFTGCVVGIRHVVG